MYTSSGPYYTFEEKLKGSIEVGMLGDLVVLSEDFMGVQEERIREIKAVVTVVGREGGLSAVRVAHHTIRNIVGIGFITELNGLLNRHVTNIYV